MSTLESPGEAVRRLLDAKGWSQSELAFAIGVTAGSVNQVLNGKRAITPEMAKLLGVALDAKPEQFLQIQNAWSLSMAPDPSQDVRERVAAQTRFPLREMAKRGWIPEPRPGDSIEGALCRFFGVNTLQSLPVVGHAAKRTEGAQPSGAQIAWLYRVRAIAAEMLTGPYRRDALLKAVDQLELQKAEPEFVRHVPRLLEEAGVRFVLVEGLPGGRIDGVCTWLSDDAPVIGMSLRFDRIDNFWFVLRHEIAHVLHGHGKSTPIIDVDLGTDDAIINDEEDIANREAAEFCVATSKLNQFIARKTPFFSEGDVRAFAKINRVHPGLVVGQLQRASNNYRLLRQFLVPIRKFVTSSAVVDGWGNFVPTN